MFYIETTSHPYLKGSGETIAEAVLKIIEKLNQISPDLNHEFACIGIDINSLSEENAEEIFSKMLKANHRGFWTLKEKE